MKPALQCGRPSRRGALDQCVPVAVEVVSSVASGDAAPHAVAVGLTLEGGRLARIDGRWADRRRPAHLVESALLKPQ